MKRTAKDVVDEWRNSVVNNDDGELVSRINYWAVTDFCPSFAPGLGSGALWEALDRIAQDFRIWSVARSDVSAVASAKLAQFAERLSELAALSLSRPIEPPPTITPQMMSGVFAKSVNNTDPEHDHVYDHRIAAAEINKLLGVEAQASSEIRGKMMASFDKVIPSVETRVQIVNCILGALSRQGAGGK